MPMPILKSSHSQKPLILVITCNEVAVKLIQDCLAHLHYQINVADSCSQALIQLQNESPDLILLDSLAPNRNDFGFCRWLQTELPKSKTAIAMLVKDEVSAIHNALNAGAQDFITHPISPQALGHRIQLLLQNHRAYSLLAQDYENLVTAQRIAALGNWELNLPDGEMTWSRQVFSLLGYTGTDITPSLNTFAAKLKPESQQALNVLLEDSIKNSEVFESKLIVLEKNAKERFVLIKGEVIQDRGINIYLRGILQDITEQHYAEERIRFLSNYDPLTGLCNRQKFIGQLGDYIRSSGQPQNIAAIIHLGLDRFKRINHSLGHDAADNLLGLVATRLATITRAESRHNPSDDPQLPLFELARWGGDEFVLMVTDMHHIQDAAKLARRLLNEIAKPYPINQLSVSISATLGIVIFPNDGDNAIDLLKNADTAMRHAKLSNPGGYGFYTSTMNDQALFNFSLENDMRYAIERDELQPYYQAKVDMHGNIMGAELLLRWLHPKFGLILPDKFIYLAEESGLIVPMTEWLLQQASQQLRIWSAMGLKQVSVAINLSPLHLNQSNLPLVIEQSLQNNGVEGALIELELTEGSLLKNKTSTLNILETLKTKGINLAIDDFGTGYSSFSYLTRFPIDTVKIDRSFLNNCTQNIADLNIIRAIIALAHTLGMKVVAEGVETQRQADILKQEGCDFMQGYLFGKPLPADQFTAEILANRLSNTALH